MLDLFLINKMQRNVFFNELFDLFVIYFFII